MPVKTYTVSQSKLTGECWLIQFRGKEACEKCEYKDKRNACGGMDIRETGKNAKGFTVPL